MPEVEAHAPAKSNERSIGMAIAVLAVLLAFVSALGNEQDNEKIVNEIKASNHYAFFQAKRIREALNTVVIDQMKLDALGNPTEAQREAMKKHEAKLAEKNAEYKDENKKILIDAEGFAKAAKFASEKGDGYDRAELFLQIAVVLCSITLLTGQKLFFNFGIIVAVVGTVFGAKAFALKESSSQVVPPAPTPPAIIKTNTPAK